MVSSSPVTLAVTLATLSAPGAGASATFLASLRGASRFSGAVAFSGARRGRRCVHQVRPSTRPAALFIPSVKGGPVAPPKCLSYYLPPKLAQSSMALRTASSSSATDDGAAEGVDVTIEYCSGCRWMLRSSWIASELLTTFAEEPRLASVTLASQGPPLYDGGFFGVSASSGGDGERVMLWDRKVRGRFPESKEVKQLVRDCVNPDKDLGHSENKEASSSAGEEGDCIECKEEQEGTKTAQKSNDVKQQQEGEQNQLPSVPPTIYQPNHVSIEYSTGGAVDSPGNGLYRATYYASELLSMMYERNGWWKKYQQGGNDVDNVEVDGELAPVAVDRVTLIPNRLESGVLRVMLNEKDVLYEQSADEDTIMDGTRLRGVATQAILKGGVPSEVGATIELLDDDEAEEARKFFGVF